MKTIGLIPAAGFIAAMLVVAPANAADDTPTTEPTCREGLIFDPKTQTCIKQQSGVLPDDYVATYAYSLSKAGRHQEALGVLDLMENSETPRALNYRGYATRKLGRVEEGIGYYLKSVALDPDYVLVREYLGEAYMSIGLVDLALEQLNEIKKRCGANCDAFEGLERFIWESS